jgi:hypothetical protein
LRPFSEPTLRSPRFPIWHQHSHTGTHIPNLATIFGCPPWQNGQISGASFSRRATHGSLHHIERVDAASVVAV